MKLAIKGKTIDCSKILDKSVAQFSAQLKQNGIVLPDDELQRLYNTVRKSVESKKQEESK